MKKKIPTFIPLAAILLLFVYVQLSYSQVSNLAQNITGAWILTKRESQGPSFILNDDNCKYGEVLEVKGEELLVELQSVCEGGKKSKDPITTKINHLYYLDERGETNDFLSVGKIFSKTKLSDKSIIVRFYWKGDE